MRRRVSVHTFRRLLCGAYVSADLQSAAVKYKGLCPDKKVPICILQRKDELATDTAEDAFFRIGNPYIWFGRISNPPERHRLKIPICILQRKDKLAIDTAEEVFFGLESLYLIWADFKSARTRPMISFDHS